MWFVSRQIQWPEGDHCVEISAGGIDYANPDMLVEKYPGEAMEYNDPRKAVEVAIAIAQAWSKATTNPITIAHGATGGMTMPFEGQEITEETFKELKEWADKAYEELPKCSQCGELLPEKGIYTAPDFAMDDEKFCREYCADEFVAYQQKFQITLQVEDLDDEKVRELLSKNDWEFNETDTAESLKEILLKDVLSGEIVLE